MRKVLHIGDEMENKKSIDLDLERRDFEASGICTKSMFENVMWDQWQFKYVPLVREKKICDNAIKINDRFLGWKAAKSQATPEGFVLVPKVPSEEILPINSLYEILDCQECCDAGGFCQERYIQIIEGISKAMIEAQEQSHDNSN